MSRPKRIVAAGFSALSTVLIILGVVSSAGAVVACSVGGTGSTNAASLIDTKPVRADVVPRRVTTWPTWGFSAVRTRVGPSVKLPGTLLWKKSETVGPNGKFGDLIEYPPSIAGNALFYCTNGGGQGAEIISRSLATGAELWRYKLPFGSQLASEPTVSSGVVYVGTMRARPERGGRGYVPRLLALKATSTAPAGTLLWQYSTGRAIESSPLVIGDRIYFATQNGVLYCLSKSTHRKVWSKSLAGKTTSSPAYDMNGHLVVSTYDGVVWSIGIKSGQVNWKQSVRGQFYGSPAVYGSRIIVASKSNGKLYCLDVNNGRTLWSYATNQGLYASPAVWNNTIFIGSKFRCFWAVDVRTGQPIWPNIRSKRYATPIYGSASVLGGKVYFSRKAETGKRGATYAVDARTGRVAWTWKDGCYSPATAVSGTILITGHHSIYAFAPRR
jgi:outer membrane protein assembly factor BamB